MPTKTTLAGRVRQPSGCIDATDRRRPLAVQIATILRSKHKPTYLRVDSGDFVIVTNVERSDSPGTSGAKDLPVVQPIPRRAEDNSGQRDARPQAGRFCQAVKRMVPRSRLGRAQMDKLKMYVGPSHPHQAQKPKDFKLS